MAINFRVEAKSLPYNASAYEIDKNFQHLMQKLKRAMAETAILKELRDRAYFERATDRRKRKAIESLARDKRQRERAAQYRRK